MPAFFIYHPSVNDLDFIPDEILPPPSMGSYSEESRVNREFEKRRFEPMNDSNLRLLAGSYPKTGAHCRQALINETPVGDPTRLFYCLHDSHMGR